MDTFKKAVSLHFNDYHLIYKHLTKMNMRYLFQSHEVFCVLRQSEAVKW